MTLIAISGFMGSGKDTVADYLIKNYNFKKESLAFSLKDATSYIFNWPRDLLEGNTAESRIWRETPDEWWSERLEIENFTPRLALQLLGTEVFRNSFHTNIWVYSLESRLRDIESNIVITDCRFPNEISMIKSLGGKVVMVHRDEYPEWYEMAIRVNTTEPELYSEFKSKYNVHDSEFKWIGTEFDYIIDNSGTLEDLYNSIIKMMNLFSIENR